MEIETAKDQVATDETNGNGTLEEISLDLEDGVSTELDETVDASVVVDSSADIPSVSSTETSTTPTNVVSVSPNPLSSTTSEANVMANQRLNSKSNEKIDDWVVMPDSAWPPPIFMKKSVSPNERFYLTHRWHSQWSYYDSKASEAKNVYYRLQYIVVIGSLIIPALVSLNSTVARFITEIAGGTSAFENVIRIGADVITVVISLAVAGAAAIESLKKYGENWNSYRSAAEELQAEKNYYDMVAGPYVNNPNPFATFVDRVEGIIANQNGKYFQAVQQQLQKQEAEHEEIVASFKSSDDDEEYEMTVSKQSSPVQTETEVAAG